ncbi:hypothetical protein EW146_g6833 [Bondarzewia mesenterica]|uniref:Alpha/beta hydrolase fold-3 domain-containing protein n=1 Tax=Bondarzewia mesenterica TaxID=1095465 RepID=A0A4S4LT40_9AGAM|nr:hypothetical protein EW146_g6833 [Bondarzewia mesenterica]
MSQYAHLSTPDPDFAVYLAQLPPATNYATDVLLSREHISKIWLPQMRERLAPTSPPGEMHVCSKTRRNCIPHLLCLSCGVDSEYRVEDHNVAVENGEIRVRCLIPTPAGVQGRTYPVLVWYHGGGIASPRYHSARMSFMLIFLPQGWALGDIELDDLVLRPICVELQIVIVNVEYRRAFPAVLSHAPEHPFPIGVNDCYAALKWAAEHDAQLSVNLSQGFIVGGASAGGNLAAVMALRARDDPFFKGRALTGQLLDYPATIHADGYPEKRVSPPFTPRA